MKRCPKCRRDCYDETLSFCLDDGEHLVEGPASAGTPLEFAADDFPSEAPTRRHINTTEDTSVLSTQIGELAQPRPVRNKWLLILPLALAIVGLTAFLGYRYFQPAASQQIDSLAVLPFENGTGDSSLDYLSDGLSESLIDKLSQLPGMKVIARSSSFKYRGPDVNIQEVANKLNVDAVVMGKVSKVGDQFSIRAEVIDAADNKQLWGEQYVRRQADLVSLQQDVARAVSEKLKLKLTGAQSEKLAKPESVNPVAFDLYLQGRQYSTRGGTDNEKKAYEFYRQATEVDPKFALAYANVSAILTVLGDNAVIDPAEALPKAEAAARKAVELDEALPQAHMALGRYYRKTWQWKSAEDSLKRSIDLNPSLGIARRNLAMYLSTMGRHDEAIREMTAARDLDPLSVTSSAYLAYPFLFARRYDEGIKAASRAVEMDANHPFSKLILGDLYNAAGRYREAIKCYEKAIETGWRSNSIQTEIAISYVGLGEKNRALEILEKLKTGSEYNSPAGMADVYAALGMKDEAFAWLEKAFADRDPQLEYLKVEPWYDSLRGDPRYADLVKRVGFPE